ncbi:hypothetical protein NPS01_35270 [Nocardioides psychrotolerans]|nr:hypothetical protein NPS01_35270 [Nocardioides psychrotolerans]
MGGVAWVGWVSIVAVRARVAAPAARAVRDRVRDRRGRRIIVELLRVWLGRDICPGNARGVPRSRVILASGDPPAVHRQSTGSH